MRGSERAKASSGFGRERCGVFGLSGFRVAGL